MSFKDLFKKSVSSFLKKILAVNEFNDFYIGYPKRILVIRQHNQFGDQLAGISVLRAIKERFPHSNLTLIASPENYYAVLKNEFIDNLFVFDKKKIWEPKYFLKLRRIIKQNYDLAIVPATVAVSSTSCILAGFSNAKIKIGPRILNGVDNPYKYIFHYQIALDWRKHPDTHVSDFIQEIIRPFGISTKKFNASIIFDKDDLAYAERFIEFLGAAKNKLIIGFHMGAGKPGNRWPIEKFIELIRAIKNNFELLFYITGSKADKYEIEYIQNYFGNSCGYFIDKRIPQLTALISISSFFITNDTGVMHVAGATSTPQISIFGPTNPFNWAPIGETKYFIKKSDLIDDISVEDVYDLFKYVMRKKKN